MALARVVGARGRYPVGTSERSTAAGAATLAHFRRMAGGLAELEDADRLAAAHRDPGEILAGWNLAAAFRKPRVLEEEPEGEILMRRCRSLHG